MKSFFFYYVKIVWRYLKRDTSYSLINILGLAIGISVALLITQFIHFELSFDQFHSNAHHVYRLTQTAITEGEEDIKRVYTTYALGVKAKESIPEIDEFARIHTYEGEAIVTNPLSNERFKEASILFVEANFLDVFSFPMLQGDITNALLERHHIVISKRMSLKYFGNEDPLGKPLKVNGEWTSGDFIVSGVLSPLPKNSHLQFDFLLPMSRLLEIDQYRESNGWDWTNFVTYVSLQPSASVDKVVDKLNEVVTTNNGVNLEKSNTQWDVGIQPLLDVHLRSEFPDDPAHNNGNIVNVRVFTLIAILILAIAWINYISLSTGRAMYRAKEVGIRKSIGAPKIHLTIQFMLESGLVNLISAILALVLALLILPILNEATGNDLELKLLSVWEFWLWFLCSVIISTLISGIYPALVLSNIRPMSMLGFNKSKSTGSFSVRRVLIVFQFFISIILISSTLLFYNQVTYMKSQELGLEMDKILVVHGPRAYYGESIEPLLNTFKSEANSHSSVLSVSGSGSVPSKEYNWRTNIQKKGESELKNKFGYVVWTDYDFSTTYDFQFLAGRSYEKGKHIGVVINEKAVKELDLGSADEAIDQMLSVGGFPARVIGVVKNFHWYSLKDAQTPYLLVPDEESSSYLSIKMNLLNIQQTLAHIEESYKKTFPHDPFNYFFLEDEFNSQYQSDLRFRNLFTIFTGLAIFLSCLGLYALVSFNVHLKTKEIGIRKVLGANTTNLLILLFREYIILIVVASLIAAPVIVFNSKSWLENYAFKIPIGVDLFVIPCLILILVSFLTTSKSILASIRSNPTKSLRVD